MRYTDPQNETFWLPNVDFKIVMWMHCAKATMCNLQFSLKGIEIEEEV